MVDFKKYLKPFADQDNLDPRSAAEIMATGWVTAETGGSAGPLASQVFDAAVMREQVDPR